GRQATRPTLPLDSRGRRGLQSTRGMHETLQEGIYFGPGERPPGFFTFLLLEPTSDRVTVQQAADLLSKLWALYAGLKDGAVPDLPGVKVPCGKLNVLLGLGARAFALPGRPTGAVPVPKAQSDFRFARPDEHGGRICEDAGIFYET